MDEFLEKFQRREGGLFIYLLRLRLSCTFRLCTINAYNASKARFEYFTILKTILKKHILSQNNRLVTQTDSERGTRPIDARSLHK